MTTETTMTIGPKLPNGPELLTAASNELIIILFSSPFDGLLINEADAGSPEYR